MEELLELIDARQWRELAGRVAVMLEDRACSGPRPSGVSEEDWEDTKQSFLADLSGDGAWFWRNVRCRTASTSALCALIRRVLRNRHWKGVERRYGEKMWLVRRTMDLLTENRRSQFQCRPWNQHDLYGLASWSETPETIGEYTGKWSFAIIKDLAPFPRRLDSANVGPFADEYIEDGCVRLLEICVQYCRRTALGRGLASSGWYHLIEVGAQDLASLELMVEEGTADARIRVRGSDETLDPVYATTVAELGEGLTERQKSVLVEYTLPRVCRQEGSQAPTLHDVGEQLGVSHGTVFNDEKQTLAKLKALLEEYGATTVDHEITIKVMVKLFETGRLRALLEMERAEGEEGRGR